MKRLAVKSRKTAIFEFDKDALQKTTLSNKTKRGNCNIICKNVKFAIKSINRNKIYPGSPLFHSILQYNP